MKRTILRRTLVLSALAAVTGGAVPAHAAADVSAFAADGRQLFVGSIVSEGTRSGDRCTFSDDTVTVVADSATDSVIRLAVDGACRLVVTNLSPTASTSSVDLGGVRYTAPKTYETSATPAGAGPGVGVEVAGQAPAIAGSATDDALAAVNAAVDLAVDAAATAAANVKVDVQAVQIVENESGTQEYRDYVAAQYVKNTKNKTVGTLEPYDGACEGSYVDENVLYGPYANDILSCFYKETYNGPSRVGFVSGGTYRKSIATITIDQRKLTETFQATSSGPTVRSCSTGGALRTGWSSTCYFDIN
jgi:hypothetical protein